MYRTENRTRMFGLALSTAMAGALLAGCSAKSAPVASVSAERAAAALASGQHDQAITHAEAAVLAEPRNAAWRATLGTTYMDAGRFTSAAQAFRDAVELGDESARTQLSLALALMADGRNQQAVALLDQARGRVGASDLGLAYALAGRPGHGIDILTVALRNGENTPKVRQNLAYAYALNGQWREARQMAAQDVPADLLGDRMEEWAATAHPQAGRMRVAGLLGVPASAADPGQPVMLALANFPTVEQLAAQAGPAGLSPAAELEPVSVQAAAPAPMRELPALAAMESYPVAPSAPAAPVELPPLGDAPTSVERTHTPAANAQSFAAAFSAPARQSATMARSTLVNNTPAPARNPATQPMASGTTHLIQLGSFSSEANARRAFAIYQGRFPQLAAHEMVITEALVRGKRFWRVSAAGFAAGEARSMCNQVKSRRQGCIAYAESSPLPGAVDTRPQLASR